MQMENNIKMGKMYMKSFDTIWETIHANEEWGKYPSEFVIRFIARNYYDKDRKFVKILDYCCGAGSNTWYLAREGFDTYAFDGSQSAVNKVKARLKKESLEADLRVCDALEIDYNNDFFDCVIDNVSIYSNRYGNIVKMYEDIYRMLKDGGKMFSVMFSKNTTGYGLGKKVEKDTFINIPCGSLARIGTAHFYDIEDITDLLQKIGFNCIQADLLHYTDGGDVVEQIMVQAKK